MPRDILRTEIRSSYSVDKYRIVVIEGKKKYAPPRIVINRFKFLIDWFTGFA